MTETKHTTHKLSLDLLKSVYLQLIEKHATVFKAGATLLGVALFALSTHVPQILEYEFKAKENAIAIQVLTGKDIRDVDCAALKANQQKCLLAKYQIETAKGTTELLLLSWKVLTFLGMTLVGFSIAGFLLQRYIEAVNSTPTSQVEP